MRARVPRRQAHRLVRRPRQRGRHGFFSGFPELPPETGDQLRQRFRCRGLGERGRGQDLCRGAFARESAGDGADGGRTGGWEVWGRKGPRGAAGAEGRASHCRGEGGCLGREGGCCGAGAAVAVFALMFFFFRFRVFFVQVLFFFITFFFSLSRFRFPHRIASPHHHHRTSSDLPLLPAADLSLLLRAVATVVSRIGNGRTWGKKPRIELKNRTSSNLPLSLLVESFEKQKPCRRNWACSPSGSGTRDRWPSRGGRRLSSWYVFAVVESGLQARERGGESAARGIEEKRF